MVVLRPGRAKADLLNELLENPGGWWPRDLNDRWKEFQAMSSTSNAYPELERDLSFHPTENPRPQKLTQEQVEHYNEFGYISPLDVYSREEADTHRAFFDEIHVFSGILAKTAFSVDGQRPAFFRIFSQKI